MLETGKPQQQGRGNARRPQALPTGRTPAAHHHLHPDPGARPYPALPGGVPGGQLSAPDEPDRPGDRRRPDHRLAAEPVRRPPGGHRAQSHAGDRQHPGVCPGLHRRHRQPLGSAVLSVPGTDQPGPGGGRHRGQGRFLRTVAGRGTGGSICHQVHLEQRWLCRRPTAGRGPAGAERPPAVHCLCIDWPGDGPGLPAPRRPGPAGRCAGAIRCGFWAGGLGPGA
ncbi:hypothetical protein D3C81_1143400 [compost metagenome]